MIAKPQRSKYLRQYPTVLVFPDGSSASFRHYEPRAIVKMPLTYEDCETTEEKRDWVQRRKRLEKMEIADDHLDVSFDRSSYLKMIKRKQ